MCDMRSNYGYISNALCSSSLDGLKTTWQYLQANISITSFMTYDVLVMNSISLLSVLVQFHV